MEWLTPIIICALVGLVLLVVEMFMPGFGIPGISGTLLLIASIVMTWLEYGAKIGLGMTVAMLALMGIVISLSLKSVKNGKLANSDMMLNGAVNDGGKAEREELQTLVGQEGKTLTALRPVGAVEFSRGKMNVQSEGEFIEKDTAVRVIRVSGATVYVKQI